MNRNLFIFASNRYMAAVIAVAGAACAAGDSAAGDEEGWAEHDREEARPSYDDILAFDEVAMSVDVSHDEDLPKIQGTGFTLIEEVNLPGRRVGFYEADDGSTFEVEAGRLGAVIKRPEEAGLRGSALYEFLTQRRAPRRLIDAETRAGISRLPAPPQTAASPEDANTKFLCREQGGCTWDRDSFLNEYCRPVHRYYERIDYTGPSWLETNGTEYQKAGVFTISGQVRYNAFYQGGKFNKILLRIWTLVGAGRFIGWSHDASLRQAHTGTSVEEADGDFYDHCSNWHY